LQCRNQFAKTKTNKLFCSTSKQPEGVHLVRKTTAQQLNSSTAQQLNSSTAQQSNCFLAITLILLLLGCDGLFSAGSIQQKVGEVSHTHTQVFAGVIFASEPSYLCVPLSRLGIDSADRIERIDSSCDCVRPRLVHFLDQNGQKARALRLDFVPNSNPPSDHKPSETFALQVELGLVIANSEVKLVVDFLHALNID
jgi:hypothetical protein